MDKETKYPTVVCRSDLIQVCGCGGNEGNRQFVEIVTIEQVEVNVGEGQQTSHTIGMKRYSILPYLVAVLMKVYGTVTLTSVPESDTLALECCPSPNSTHDSALSTGS